MGRSRSTYTPGQVETNRPAATPQQPFETLTKRQRRIYASYINANGPRDPGTIRNCIALWELFDGTHEAEADMEAMLEAGWLRTIGRSDSTVEHTFDVPEADREGYVRSFVREVQARLEEPEWWDAERGQLVPGDRGPDGYRSGGR